LAIIGTTPVFPITSKVPSVAESTFSGAGFMGYEMEVVVAGAVGKFDSKQVTVPLYPLPLSYPPSRNHES
jgi:hypothetical protein